MAPNALQPQQDLKVDFSNRAMKEPLQGLRDPPELSPTREFSLFSPFFPHIKKPRGAALVSAPYKSYGRGVGITLTMN